MKHKIDIPGLPEGYRAVRYDTPKKGDLILNRNNIDMALDFYSSPWLIIEKIKPRRRVFECVSEKERFIQKGEYFEATSNKNFLRWNFNEPTQKKFIPWKEVTEEQEPNKPVMRGDADNESRQIIKDNLQKLLDHRNESAQGNLYVLLMDISHVLNDQCIDIGEHTEECELFEELRALVEELAIKCDDFEIKEVV